MSEQAKHHVGHFPEPLGVFFSAGDLQFESALLRSGHYQADFFERSLLCNTLFQQRIVIPDIFFFISPHVHSHLTRWPGKPLLKALLEQGIVMPKFRHPETDSFAHALDIIRQQEIQGLLPPQLADEIAWELDRTEKDELPFKRGHWPANCVGAEFAVLVERLLQSPTPPVFDGLSDSDRQELERYWKQTEPWRIGSIDEARSYAERTGTQNGRGLRRGDIMNAVGRNLGLPEGFQVHDNGVLFLYVRDDPKKERALYFFCRWVNECYYLNQAQQLGAIPTFPSYDLLGGLMPACALPLEIAQSIAAPPSTITETVRLPTLPAIRSIPADRLVGIISEQGYRYREALETWQNRPTSQNEDELRDSLHSYAGQLTVAVGEQAVDSPLLTAIFGAHSRATQSLLGSVLSAASTVVGVAKPEYGLASIAASLTGVGWSVLAYRRQTRREKVRVDLGSPVRMNPLPEVNLPRGTGDIVN